MRIHSREAAIQPVTDVTLDRDGAQWPPRLSAMERADIMRPEAMRNERQLLAEPFQGGPRRHLLVCSCMLYNSVSARKTSAEVRARPDVLELVLVARVLPLSWATEALACELVHTNVRPAWLKLQARLQRSVHLQGFGEKQHILGAERRGG